MEILQVTVVTFIKKYTITFFCMVKYVFYCIVLFMICPSIYKISFRKFLRVVFCQKNFSVVVCMVNLTESPMAISDVSAHAVDWKAPRSGKNRSGAPSRLGRLPLQLFAVAGLRRTKTTACNWYTGGRSSQSIMSLIGTHGPPQDRT